MFDDDELARRARTTMAGADVGVLLVADGGPAICSETVVSVHDDEGEAVMGVPLDTAWLGSITSARAQWGSLVLKPAQHHGVALTLSGRLHRVDQDAAQATSGSISDAKVGSIGSVPVAIRVEKVWALCPGLAASAAVTNAREIPLMRYASAEPDLFAANSRRVMNHLNRCHGEQLRVWVAAHAATTLDEVAGAAITDLTREGLDICRVDSAGAHHTHISFGSPVQTLDQFAHLLRRYLGEARAHTPPRGAD